jgi:hypothetical protein
MKKPCSQMPFVCNYYEKTSTIVVMHYGRWGSLRSLPIYKTQRKICGHLFKSAAKAFDVDVQ